eukprot:jgi/Botrbrau1/15526/Bobra.0123s0002.1
MASRSSAVQMPQPESVYEQYLRKSIFSFASPELEMKYQNYVGNQLGGYILALGGAILFGYIGMVSRTFCVLRMDPSVLPRGFLMSLVLGLLPIAFIVTMVVFRSKTYAKHWRTINLVFMCSKVLSTEYVQMVFLWIQSPHAPDTLHRGLDRVSQLPFRMFFTENFYVATTWSLVLVFATGQATDLGFATLGLALSFANNSAICASALWGPEPFTLSSPMQQAARTVSSWLYTLLSANGFPPIFFPRSELSCPEVRGLWQLLGWWVSCILVLLREVASRRAFLRSSSALLRSSFTAEAKRWPFGNQALLQKLVCAIVALCLMPSIIWVTALELFPKASP